MKISAVICTYNRCDLLPEAIRSLMNQTLDESLYEILVVDNASTDTTKIVCDNHAKVSNFRYIFEASPGLSIARNTAAEAVSADYIAYLDDDAIASPCWLESIVDAFESVSPKPAAVGGRVSPIWETVKPEWFPDEKLTYLTILDHGCMPRFLSYPDILFGTNMAFNRELLLASGGFRTDAGRVGTKLVSGEEMALFKVFNERSLLLYYVPEAEVGHLVPKERLTKQWLYRRHYWQGRAIALVQLQDANPAALMGSAGLFLIKLCLNGIAGIFGCTDRSRVLRFANVCANWGSVVQICVLLKNRNQGV